MGSVPVAKPSPLRSWRFSRRVIPLALLGVITLAAVAVAVAVAWPSDPQQPDWVVVAGADDLSTNEQLQATQAPVPAASTATRYVSRTATSRWT